MAESEPLVRCPHCGGNTVAGKFCDRCGRPLESGNRDVSDAGAPKVRPAADGRNAPGATGEGEPAGHRPGRATPGPEPMGAAAPSSPAPETCSPSSEEAAPLEEETLRRSGSEIVRAPKDDNGPGTSPSVSGADVPADREGGEGAPKLKLEVNALEFGVLGWMMPLSFQLSGECRDLREVSVEAALESEGVVHWRLRWKDENGELARTGKWGDKGNFTAKSPEWKPGAPFLTWRVRARDRDAEYEWCGKRSLRVFEKEEPPQAVVEQVFYDIKQGHAGDVHINGARAAEIRKRDRMEKARNIRDLVDVVSREAPVWQPAELKLVRGGGTPGNTGPAPDIETDTVFRLTLLAPKEQRIHLLTGSELGLGKHRENDIRTLVHPGLKSLDALSRDERVAEIRKASEAVSRFHCRVLWEDGRCLVADGGEYKGTIKPSTWGTAVDDVEIDPETGPVPLPLDRAVSLRLACGIPAEESGAFTFTARVVSCGNIRRRRPGAPLSGSDSDAACLVLERTDGVPETFVAVWHGCLIEDVLHLRRGGGLIRFSSEDGVFVLTPPRGRKPVPLRPGADLRVGGRSSPRLRVTEFRQYRLY